MCRYHIDAKTCCCTVLLIWNGLFWDVMLLHFTSNYPTYLNKTPVCAAFILKGMLRCFRSCAGEPWAARRACSRMWLASTTRRRQRGGATRPVFKDTGRPGALNPLTPAGSRAAAEHRAAARRTPAGGLCSGFTSWWMKAVDKILETPLSVTQQQTAAHRDDHTVKWTQINTYGRF